MNKFIQVQGGSEGYGSCVQRLETEQSFVELVADLIEAEVSQITNPNELEELQKEWDNNGYTLEIDVEDQVACFEDDSEVETTIVFI